MKISKLALPLFAISLVSAEPDIVIITQDVHETTTLAPSDFWNNDYDEERGDFLSNIGKTFTPDLLTLTNLLLE